MIWRFINWIESNWIRFILATHIHPFITLVLFRVVGLLELVPDATGREAGHNLHKLPLYLSANTKRDKQPFTHTTAENNYQLTWHAYLWIMRGSWSNRTYKNIGTHAGKGMGKGKAQQRRIHAHVCTYICIIRVSVFSWFSLIWVCSASSL